ncbi:hypothetical protein KSP39_PZI016190 [Platanthera zijinensis]|uniref:Uncharacterized protein n=1 Tax=Platanthera zijinensis TaxID=2320716 RepID=A0AAP0B6Y5_9ASPA
MLSELCLSSRATQEKEIAGVGLLRDVQRWRRVLIWKKWRRSNFPCSDLDWKKSLPEESVTGARGGGLGHGVAVER